MTIHHTFSTLSIVRASRSKNDKLPVYLRITVDGKRAEISTKEYVDGEKWDKVRGRLKGNSQEAREVNGRLNTWETKVKEHYNQFLRDDKRVNAQVLKNSVLGIAERDNDFLSYFEAHEQEVKSKIGIDYSSGTHKNYIATLKHLRTYIARNYKGQVVTLKDLDYDFLSGFESFLKLAVGNSNNGSIKHIQRVKRVINLAIKRGKLTTNPFATFSVKKEKTNRDFLSADELRAIEMVELKKLVLIKVRDIFVFICYTGLSYSDLAELSENELMKGIDGDTWISIDRNKTGVATRIPVLPPALVVLNKYQDHPQALSKGTLLPVMSNQKMNKYLKELAEKCGIHKPVTCHIGRHTFATTVTLSNDIPIETVSQMLGHTNLKTTQIYAKVIEKKISQDMNKLKGLYSVSDSDSAVNQ
ncbi:MAG: site-specific integrase [Cytophagales bacterium]|nr:site-specific integrase [Cytophagales bacterium]